MEGEKLPLYELVAMPGCFYEGEWEKGKQHGKGKVYATNGIYFEGEFDQGLATGIDGLLVYPDGSYYRGEFSQNSFNGKGR